MEELRKWMESPDFQILDGEVSKRAHGEASQDVLKAIDGETDPVLAALAVEQLELDTRKRLCMKAAGKAPHDPNKQSYYCFKLMAYSKTLGKLKAMGHPVADKA